MNVTRKDFLKGAFGLAALPAAECAAGFAPPAPLRRSEELADVTLSNGDFAGGETATAEIGRTPDSGDKFFKAGIGGK